MNRVVYTTGDIFSDGGWFTDPAEGIHVQVRQNHDWVDVTGLSVSPAYPYDSSAGPNSIYTFTFDDIAGDGVRIIGKAGGSANFASISELAVYFSVDDGRYVMTNQKREGRGGRRCRNRKRRQRHPVGYQRRSLATLGHQPCRQRRVQHHQRQQRESPRGRRLWHQERRQYTPVGLPTAVRTGYGASVRSDRSSGRFGVGPDLSHSRSIENSHWRIGDDRSS